MKITNIPPPQITTAELAAAEVTRIFDSQNPEMADLKQQHSRGLITSLEFSHKTVELWNKFRRELERELS